MSHSRAMHASEGVAPSESSHVAEEVLSNCSTDFGFEALGDDRDDPLVGRDIGGVVISSFIAQGGMGRVYAARQTSPSRVVAVKVMRPGRRSPTTTRRFIREAKVLARLQHPGIAQIFVAGTCIFDGDETPFFVMEFVDAAKPLVKACDHRGLDVRQRLEIFHETCVAVGHGHAAGIVHRDLKPGNILVDIHGHPRVIDFGIASIAEDDTADITETGALVGTRQYMSPEQCDGNPTDQRTDVYSLGVILYELLTGRLPYDLTGKTLSETARIIREGLPARLQIADRSLGRAVDAIANTCLAKRPADRYGSAAELAADVQRLLESKPLRARPRKLFDTFTSRCRRHRTGIVSVVATATSVAIVTIVQSSLPASRNPRTPWPVPVRTLTNGEFRFTLTAQFDAIPSPLTTPLQSLSVTFDEPIQSLSTADFRLFRDGISVPLDGVTVTGNRNKWEIRDLQTVTNVGGWYCLSLEGTDTSPVDFGDSKLASPAKANWLMPPYHEFSFNLLSSNWQQHVVSASGIQFHSARDADRAIFIQPTTPGEEGSIILRFESPFPIHTAKLTAPIVAWTTDTSDPGVKAALDVSPDGTAWFTLETLENDRGGIGGGPFDIGQICTGSKEVWVRARLTATKVWSTIGLIHAQFLRSDPAFSSEKTFRLTLTGVDPRSTPTSRTGPEKG